jgi:hypothetical protein
MLTIGLSENATKTVAVLEAAPVITLAVWRSP